MLPQTSDKSSGFQLAVSSQALFYVSPMMNRDFAVFAVFCDFPWWKEGERE